MLCRVFNKSKGEGMDCLLESETEAQSSYSTCQLDTMPQYQYDQQMNSLPMFTNTSYQHANSSNTFINSGGLMPYGDIPPMLCVDRGNREGDRDYGFMLDLGLDGHELLANL